MVVFSFGWTSLYVLFYIEITICDYSSQYSPNAQTSLIPRRDPPVPVKGERIVLPACCRARFTILSCLLIVKLTNRAREQAWAVSIHLLFPLRSLSWAGRVCPFIVNIYSWNLTDLSSSVYLIFLFWDAIECVIIYFAMVETKRLTLERKPVVFLCNPRISWLLSEIDEVFNQPNPRKYSMEHTVHIKRRDRPEVWEHSICSLMCKYWFEICKRLWVLC